MAYVILEHRGMRSACVLGKRVLVGRSAVCDLAILHDAVAPLHAWIGTDDAGVFVVDLQQLSHDPSALPPPRRYLRDTEAIAIGPALLRYCEDPTLPEGTRLLRPRNYIKLKDWLLFDCPCGAPMLTAASLVGRSGQCRLCGRRIVIPTTGGGVAAECEIRVPTTAGKEAAVCGVCQWPVEADDDAATCPHCALQFHRACWTENQGCCSYGCEQVGILSRQSSITAAKPIEIPTEVATPGLRGRQLLFPAVAVGASVGGMFLFGVPAILCDAVAIWRLQHGADAKGHPAHLISAAVSTIGTVAGLLVSSWYWFAAGHAISPSLGGLVR